MVLSVGVRPENALATAAGLEVGPRGGIRVNEHMQTSDPDIYAVGDAVEVRDFVTGDPTQIPLAGPANRQGRIAADHIFGRPSSYRGTQGHGRRGRVRHDGRHDGVEREGASPRGPRLRKDLSPSDAARRLLSRRGADVAQAAVRPGRAASCWVPRRSATRGVDKRIDVLAMAIQAGMTVFDLEEAELAYAPQFGSAKDPINMAGFIAAGVVRGDAKVVHAADLRWSGRYCDVRTRAEFDCGHIPGAVNLPLDELRERLGEVDRGQRTIAYCQLGQRGYLATRILAQAGYDVANLSGGYMTYCQTTR